ncbi:MAG: leucyl/phenylalanyl-tRNA--protein transferase [Desulfovibrio sp.]|jgi:leucyl/phenylalanyl-tRNA--protein transferase|nr:leucyl/phenylalanyl-tRNA--protein transferase [Desulfovibrio sp.]
MPVYRLPESEICFPDPFEAREDGLLAVGGDLSPQRLVAAYCLGLFPWYDIDSPRLWWSPDPRCILLPEEFHLPRSLKRVLRAGVFSFSLDRAFADVIKACAEERADTAGTWLIPEMIEAYINLHRLGLAHSVEAWRDGTLAGGLYGLALGGVFFGESMFYAAPDASKAAFACLVEELKHRDFTLIDCQQTTPHMQRFGAKAVKREEFMRLLTQGLSKSFTQGAWTWSCSRPAEKTGKILAASWA